MSNKPRLYRKEGTFFFNPADKKFWRCGLRNESLMRHGMGRTPTEAYNDWKYRRQGTGRFG